jgi:hypothetical protein
MVCVWRVVYEVAAFTMIDLEGIEGREIGYRRQIEDMVTGVP